MRHAEFGRACVKQTLDSAKIPIHYCGIIGENLKKLQEGVQSLVYNSWDASDASPPRERARPERVNPVDQLQLEVLAVNRGVPCWPDVILSKFHESTEEHKTLLKMKTAFEREFQVSQRNANANTNRVTSSTQGNRCSGVCDYTVDGGKEPLDVQRVIDLPHVGLESFESDNRPGLIFGELIFQKGFAAHNAYIVASKVLFSSGPMGCCVVVAFNVSISQVWFLADDLVHLSFSV